MKYVIIIASLVALLCFATAYAQHPAQQVTIPGYSPQPDSNPPSDRNVSRDMPLSPNQNVNTPTSNLMDQEGAPGVSIPPPLPNSSTQPMGQPSAPNSVMQPALPAIQPLPPSVPTPEQPATTAPNVIQGAVMQRDRSTISHAKPMSLNNPDPDPDVASPGQIAKTSNMTAAPVQQETDFADPMMMAPVQQKTDFADPMTTTPTHSPLQFDQSNEEFHMTPAGAPSPISTAPPAKTSATPSSPAVPSQNTVIQLQTGSK